VLVVQLIPVILSLLVLGAHFLRSGPFALVVVALVLIGLTAVPRGWAARTVQVALVLGALEWVRTLVALATARSRMGLPSTRLVMILGAVVLVTAASAWVFQGRRARVWYRLAPRDAPRDA